LQVKLTDSRKCKLTGIGKDKIPEDIGHSIEEVEKDFCRILSGELKKGISARDDCSKIANQVREVYYDGKPFDSSLQSFLHVSLHRDDYPAMNLMNRGLLLALR